MTSPRDMPSKISKWNPAARAWLKNPLFKKMEEKSDDESSNNTDEENNTNQETKREDSKSPGNDKKKKATTDDSDTDSTVERKAWRINKPRQEWQRPWRDPKPDQESYRGAFGPIIKEFRSQFRKGSSSHAPGLASSLGISRGLDCVPSKQLAKEIEKHKRPADEISAQKVKELLSNEIPIKFSSSHEHSGGVKDYNLGTIMRAYDIGQATRSKNKAAANSSAAGR